MAVVGSMASMAGTKRDSGRQEHRDGKLKTVDNVLRDRIEAAMNEKGWERQQLAAKVDVVPGSITNLLKRGEPRQIRYLPRLLAVLGLKDQLQEVVDGWPDLPIEDRNVIAALVAAKRRREG